MLASQLSFFPYLEHQTSERPSDFIPVYEPCLGEREEAYVLDAIRSGWISKLGKYVDRFEELFADYCDTAHAVSVCNGTVALHLALHALNIGAGDEVIVPALTFAATANAVCYTGATPIFADVDPVTWNIDPEYVQHLISSQTKAILPVHIYGHPASMPAINDIADRHGLWVIEDAAEAHGAEIEGQRTGSLGHIAGFSFMANKIITTGEGGMVTTNDTGLAERCRHLRDQAMPPHRRYWHDEIGFNYWMTNLQAAVGVAQIERIGEFIQRKREIAMLYNQYLADLPGLTLPAELPGYTNTYWMYSVIVQDDYPLTRDDLSTTLREYGVDSRPFFHSLDTLPHFHSDAPCPTALNLSQRGLNLPSAPTLTDEQVRYICQVFQRIVQTA